MSGELTPLEDDLLAALDPGEIAVHAAGLAAAQAESGRDRTAAFIRARLRAWGIPTAVERLDALVSLPGKARLSLARRDAPVTALTLPYSPATPEEGIVAELRVVTPDGARAADLHGTIALIDGPPTPEGVALLAARGALAQVYIGAGETLRPVPVPTPWGEPAATPAIVIGRAAGEGFLALAASGATPVRLTVAAGWTTRRLVVPIATIKGADEPQNFLLVGVHSPAPDESGEAAACLLELCRVFAAEAARLRRGLRCVWWPGGVAPGAGPTWYSDQTWAELGQRAGAYVEIHPPRRKGLKTLQAWAEPGGRPFAEAALSAGGVRALGWASAPEPTSAAPFARRGLPTIRLAAAGATTVGSVVPTLARLCTSPLLPFAPLALARAIEGRTRAITDAVGERLDFAPLHERAEGFRAATERLQIALLHIAQGESPSFEEGVEIGNRLLMRLDRLILPALRHPGDPFDLPTVLTPHPFPGLDAVIPFLAADGSDLAELLRLRAAAIRERNRALDTLAAATAAIDDALTALRPLGFG